MLATAVLYLFAGLYWFYLGNWRMGVITLTWVVADIIYFTMK